MKKTLGTVQVYTGNGKGKTTAALGQALRALGHGQRVYMMQFMKAGATGEKCMARKLEGFVLVQCGRKGFVRKGKASRPDIRRAREGLARALRAMESGRHDVVILDEVNPAMGAGLLTAREVVDVVAKKPCRVELILTGRGAPDAILHTADLVSEIREVKHPFRIGLRARPGVEF